MLPVNVINNTIHIGRHFSLTFQRTLRIPDDGGTYPLPPGLGTFPVLRVEDYADRVPASWREHGGVFIPMYQREALWLNFGGAYWRPNALKIGIGKINAISGKTWDQSLHRSSADYVVVPDQPWLDGINAGRGFIRQFVAMPLGMGYTVESQLTGKEESGGIQVIVYDPNPGRFPDKEPERAARGHVDYVCCCAAPAAYGEMGLAAGGRMKQKIYPDAYGFDSWDQENNGRVYVHIVNSQMFREITGMEPPSTPVSAKEYAQWGMPWFDLYDEGKGDIVPPDELAGIKSIHAKDKEKGFVNQQDDSTVPIPSSGITVLGQNGELVKDGKW